MSDEELPPEKLVCEARPEITLEQCLAIGKTHSLSPPFLLGIRGYENPGQNETGVYDDCICVVDTVSFEAFNANTDPSKHARGMATVIAPQIIKYKIGVHNLHKDKSKQYQALVQASPIAVNREGVGEVPPGWFGINIHRGGVKTPGSEGCQTLPPDQWPEFMRVVWEVLKMRKLWELSYLLVER